ncbi:MAG: CPBP family intramembrane metalloprotease [Phycisphaerae bacterium]|nr:CPBP family intramembrane metalloprotease [Phycisphaerae bacterium]
MLLAVSNRYLEAINWGFVGVGTALWLGLIARWYRQRNDPLALAPPRPSDLTVVAIPMCMAAYLTGLLVAQWLTNQYLKPGTAAEVGVHLDRVVPTVVAGMLGAAMCLWLGAQEFPGGLRTFGLRTRRLPEEAAVAVVAFLLAFPMCVGLLSASEYVVSWWTGEQVLPNHPILDALAASELPPWARALGVIGPVIVAPMAEELFFRGIMQSFLKQYLGSRWRSLLLVSLIFGMAHYGQPQVVLPLAALGLILGYLYERRGSLVAPIILHILFNTRTILWQTLGETP